MLKLIFLSLLFISFNRAQACPGPESEVAQENRASVIFEGRPISYELDNSGAVPGVTSGSLAKVSFEVQKTIRGEQKSKWTAILRGHKLPQSFSDFIKQFGPFLKVGLTDFSGKIDQSTLPQNYRNLLFVVDAACSMNGEDWLLRPISVEEKIDQEQGHKLVEAKECQLRISFGSYATGIPRDVAKKINEVLEASPQLTSFKTWRSGEEGEYDHCLKFSTSQELKETHDHIKALIPDYSKKGYTTLYLNGEITKKTLWPPAGQ